MREERKVLTALFADLVGSTPLGERLDPEDLRDVVGEAIARVIHSIEDLGGTIKDLAGDGVLALFGAPAAHEDDAERAVRAGLRLVEGIGEYAVEVARDWEIEGFAVRVGIETGLAVLGPVGAGSRIEYGATGDVINTTARLQATAEPMAVVVGPSTFALTEALFEWDEPELLTLRGKAEPVEVRRVIRVLDVRGSVRALPGASAPMIGRADELSDGLAALRELSAGRGGALLVAGEPGIGKTRLLEEMRSAASHESAQPAWLEGRCLSYGEVVPYLPFRELLRTWLGASLTWSEEQLAAGLERAVLAAGADPQIVPYLALMLQASAGEASGLGRLPEDLLQRRTFDAVATLVGALAAPSSLLLVLEDLHWSDTTSLRLVERLFEVASDRPVLIVLTYRPDPDHPSYRLAARAERLLGSRARRVTLVSLPEGAQRELLSALIGPGTLPAALEDRIVASAEGNPFFLEELIRSLVDGGALSQGDSGWRFLHEVRVEVPRTVEKVILARVDRLPRTCRDAIDAASVLGRRFGVGLLSTVSDLNGDLGDAVTELVRLDLLQNERPPPDPEYRFRHALIQEAVYGTILKKRRRELHRRAAAGLEELLAGQLESGAAILAHHHESAGNAAEALRFHRLAATVARRVYAGSEALASYTKALSLLSSIAEGDRAAVEVELLVERGGLRAETGDVAGARHDLEAGRERAAATGDRTGEMRAENGLGFVLAGAADYREASPHLDRALVLAAGLGEDAVRVEILSRLCIVECNRLRFDRSLEFGEQALQIAQSLGDELVVARALDGLKQVTFEIGDWPGFERMAAELVDIYRRHGDLWYLQFVHLEMSFREMGHGRWDEAIAQIQEGLALNRRIGDRGNEPVHLGALSRTLLLSGRLGDSLEIGSRAAEIAEELGHGEWIAWTWGHLAWTLEIVGDLAGALDACERALAAAERAAADLQATRAAGRLALIRLTRGEVDEAIAAADLCEEFISRVSVPPGRAFFLGTEAYVGAGEVWVATGRAERVEPFLEPLLAACRSNRWVEAESLGAFVVGRARAALGDEAGAEEAILGGLAVARDVQFPVAEQRGLEALAELRKREGRSGEAKQHLAEAVVLRDRLARSKQGVRASAGRGGSVA